MAANPKLIPEQQTIRFKLNGREVDALPDETILQAAMRLGTEIPYLCYKEGYRPDGNCRACVVEIKGERVLAPSCCRRPVDGMEVASTSERALHAQKLVLELLLSDMPSQGRSPYTPRSELDRWVDTLELGRPRFGDAWPVGRGELTRVEADDRALLRPVVEADAEGFFAEALRQEDRNRICGLSPIYALLRLLPGGSKAHGQLLHYGQWPDAAGTVTFASVSFEADGAAG